MKTLDIQDLFDPARSYPDPDAMELLASLVGLDEHKLRLSKMLTLLMVPSTLRNWAKKFHPSSTAVVNVMLAKPPLVILSGDVGCGKTALAESICDLVAREHRTNITLYPMSLSARGQGAVGEMTRLLSQAFDYVYDEGRKLKGANGDTSNGAAVLLIDEADALAQSREASQMHHEDRAGVNALIRGVDRLASAKLPVAVIMCTNRLDALDPAVQRRAADILEFQRPDAKQREAVLAQPLGELDLLQEDIAQIVELTGSKVVDGVPIDAGFTFSDLTQRLVPAIVLDAFPSGPVDSTRAVQITSQMPSTRPFGETGGIPHVRRGEEGKHSGKAIQSQDSNVSRKMNLP